MVIYCNLLPVYVIISLMVETLTTTDTGKWLRIENKTPTTTAEFVRSPYFKAHALDHYGHVAGLGCIVSGHPVIELHHVKINGKRSDFAVIPLRMEHHRHTNDDYFSVHGDKKTFREIYGSEIDLLMKVYEILDNKGELCDKAREIWEKI